MPSNLTNDQVFWKQLYRRAKVLYLATCALW